MSFQEDYDALTTGEKNQFSDTMNNLLFHCFIVRKRFDPSTGLDKIQYDYSFIERHFSLFEGYLDFIDMTLQKDEDNGVIYLRSAADKNRERVDTATTYVVYTLRDYYEDAISKQPNLLQVRMESTELRQRLSDLGLSTAAKRLSLQTIAGAMKTLASFNVIAKGVGSFNDNTYNFFILPSIKYVISTEKMNALYRFLSGEDDSVVVSEDGADEEEPPSPEQRVHTADKAEPEGF